MHGKTDYKETPEMTLGKGVRILVTALTVGLAVACSLFNAAPSECIAAAEDAGLPDSVIEQLRNPDGLNAVERAALQRALRQAGIDDVCDAVAETAPSTSREEERNGQTTADGAPTTEQRDGGSQATRDAPDSEQRKPGSSDPLPGARISPDDEHRRRCRFFALHLLQPVVYSEFVKLNPDDMDDLDRILWRPALHGNNSLGYYDDDFEDSDYSPALLPRNPGIYCRDYWAEPLNRANAELRNRGFEPDCRFKLEERITNQYRRLAESLNYSDAENELVYNTPNQYVRILEWLDFSGGDLLNSDNPPYRILAEQSRHPYAHLSDWIPTEDGLAGYKRENGDTVNLKWLGIVKAAGLSEGSSDLLACHYYYPQLFYGYWIPFDPDQMPGRSQSEELELPRYERATTPVYLPKSVAAKTVRVGYPLGKMAERYHLCHNSSETEEVGYYYVDHPAGDYCELKP